MRDALLDRPPFDKVQMPRLQRKIPETLTTDKVARVFRACKSARDRAICLFLLDSGVRVSEMLALAVGDVDRQSGMVTVRLGKGQKGRTTFVGVSTRKQLRRYLAERDGYKPYAPPS